MDRLATVLRFGLLKTIEANTATCYLVFNFSCGYLQPWLLRFLQGAKPRHHVPNPVPLQHAASGLKESKSFSTSHSICVHGGPVGKWVPVILFSVLFYV